MNYINQLPVNTWNHLKVNQGTLEIDVPNTLLPFQPSNLFKLPESLHLEDKELQEFKEISEKHFNKNEIELQEFMNQSKNATLYLHAKQNEVIQNPITASYLLDDKNRYLLDENIIVAEEGSEITILLDYKSKAEGSFVHGGITKLYAKKNSKINLIQVQLLNDESLHFDQILGYVEDSASINVTQIELGASKNFVGSEVILASDAASYENQTIYLGTEKQTIDMNYLAKHYGKHSKSKMIAKGCLDDQSKKIFRATIDFKRGCNASTGEELEETLLLSPNIKNQSVPLILCEEEDVSGVHAANIGNLKDSQLFYLMSRGLTAEEAKQLLIRSRLQSIYERVPNDNLKSEIENYISEKLKSSLVQSKDLDYIL